MSMNNRVANVDDARDQKSAFNSSCFPSSQGRNDHQQQDKTWFTTISTMLALRQLALLERGERRRNTDEVAGKLSVSESDWMRI